ncbi:CopG family transcriptional regulator [bacterium]|nr:CopG family transcriptional regulator [bacterium]
MRKRVWVIRTYSMPQKVADLVDEMSARNNMGKSELIRAALRLYEKEVDKNGSKRK